MPRNFTPINYLQKVVFENVTNSKRKHTPTMTVKGEKRKKGREVEIGNGITEKKIEIKYIFMQILRFWE